MDRSALIDISLAVRTGVAHGLGLSLFLLAMGLAPEGLIFLGLVQALGFLAAHCLLGLRDRLWPQIALNASTTAGWPSGSATSAKRIS